METGNILKSPLGSYTITKKLGHGAFGDVYLANYTPNNSSTTKQVAVKEIARYCSDMEKCKKEGELMKKISESIKSEHLVKYIDSFLGEVTTGGFLSQWLGQKSPSDGNLFIVMQYCSLGDFSNIISEKLKSKSEFEKKLIYNYIYQIADGIDGLHQQKIVHRDLKPPNILVNWEGGKEVLKISDFGLAKLRDQATVMANYPKRYGTPIYMAPEQDRGEPCRFSVDVWAIGIIFYELCTTPKNILHEFRNIREKVNKDQTVTLPQRFSTEDNNWLSKMIAKDPTKRINSTGVKKEANSRK